MARRPTSRGGRRRQRVRVLRPPLPPRRRDDADDVRTAAAHVHVAADGDAARRPGLVVGGRRGQRLAIARSHRLVDPDVWQRLVASYPLIAPWVDAEPMTKRRRDGPGHRSCPAVRRATGSPWRPGSSPSATPPRARTHRSAGASRSLRCSWRRCASAVRDVGTERCQGLTMAYEARRADEVDPYLHDTLHTSAHRLAQLEADAAGVAYEPDDPAWRIGGQAAGGGADRSRAPPRRARRRRAAGPRRQDVMRATRHRGPARRRPRHPAVPGSAIATRSWRSSVTTASSGGRGCTGPRPDAQAIGAGGPATVSGPCSTSGSSPAARRAPPSATGRSAGSGTRSSAPTTTADHDRLDPAGPLDAGLRRR